jgi:hypothetical protein
LDQRDGIYGTKVCILAVIARKLMAISHMLT